MKSQVIEEMETFSFPSDEKRSINPDYIAFLEKVDSEMQASNSDYVAIAPFGPHLTGCATDSSTFGVELICTESTYTNTDSVCKDVKKIAEESNCEIAIRDCCSISFFKENFEADGYACYYHAFNILVYPFIGKMDILRDLRELGRKRHREAKKWSKLFSEGEVEEIIRHQILDETGICTELIESDTNPVWTSHRKIFQQLIDFGYSEEEVIELAKLRIKFWEQKIQQAVA